MNEDYAVYARCRGLSDMRILWTHALPHALAGLAPSFLQMVGISLAGSAIVEKIFSLPGLGYSIVDSVLYRDTPMIHATIPVFGLLSGDLQHGFRHSAADIPARPC